MSAASTAGYIKAVGDSDYNFGYNDFTVEFFATCTSLASSCQTLFEITNNESAAAELFQKTRFLVLIENGYLNAYAIQTVDPLPIPANTNTFISPQPITTNNRIFYDGILLEPSQLVISGTNVTIVNTTISTEDTLVEVGDILFQVKGGAVSVDKLHFISAERYQDGFYLFLDGISQSPAVPAYNPIPTQYLVLSSDVNFRLNRTGSPALLTIGANRDGLNPFFGEFGDFKITNGVSLHVPVLANPSTISSSFTDSALGTRSADIIVDGGGFVNSFESYAPEEHVPGQIFDTLYMAVYQSSNSNLNANILGFSMFKPSILTGPIGSYAFKTQNANSYSLVPWTSLGSADASVTVDGVPIESTNWSVRNRVMNLLASPGNVEVVATGPTSFYTISANGVSTITSNVYANSQSISVSDVSGFMTPLTSSGNSAIRGQVFINQECITYLYIDRTNNILSGLTRGVSGTGVPIVHLSGSQIISASIDRDLANLSGINVSDFTWYSNVNLPQSLQNTNSIISTILVDYGTTPPQTPF